MVVVAAPFLGASFVALLGLEAGALAEWGVGLAHVSVAHVHVAVGDVLFVGLRVHICDRD